MSTLRLGDTAPDFTQESTAGAVRSVAPKQVIRSATGPASTGRHFNDILRVTPQPKR